MDLSWDALFATESLAARLSRDDRAARARSRVPLRPGEIALLSRYRAELSGDVLELGCCGDGLTDWLAYNARDFIGVGMSVAAVDLCRGRFDNADFMVGGLTELERFEPGQFSAVVAGRRVLDVLCDERRRGAFEQIRRVLADDGVLIFSSNNLSCESLVPTPARHALTHPLRFWRLPRYLRNRARMAALQQREYGYARLSNPTGDFAQLSYYVSRDAQEMQLVDHDLVLTECSTLWDEPVGRGQDAYRQHELYYVAQPGAGWRSGLSADPELL